MPARSAANATGHQATDVLVVAEADLDVGAVRAAWAGRDLGRTTGAYPVEHDPIRRYCHMVGDTNPLHLDPEAAAAGPFGAVVCPPGLVRYFAGAGPWPLRPDEPGPTPPAIPRLGDRAINAATAWTWHRPARVGDRLGASWRVTDVHEKPTRLDDRSLWICTEATITDQDAAAVATVANTVVYHRPTAPRAGGARGGRGAPPPRPDRPAVAFGPGVRVGDGLPGFEVEVTPTVVALQVSGSQDWNLVHHDPGFATSSGHRGTFMNTGWILGHLTRVATDWVGADGWLASLTFRMRATIEPGDQVTAGGVVRAVDADADRPGSCDVELWLATERTGVAAGGTARVATGTP